MSLSSRGARTRLFRLCRGPAARPPVPGTRCRLAHVSRIDRRDADRVQRNRSTRLPLRPRCRHGGRRTVRGRSGSCGKHFSGGSRRIPYFVYVDPGASLFPKTLYSPALAIACALRTRCRFETALKWYALVSTRSSRTIHGSIAHRRHAFPRAVINRSALSARA